MNTSQCSVITLVIRTSTRAG